MARTFGTMNTYYQNADQGHIFGATMASYSYMKNQLRFGTFDKYKFFLPPSNVFYYKDICESGMKKFLKDFKLPKETLNKVQLESMDKIGPKNDLTVLHNAGPDLEKAYYYRDLMSTSSSFPIVNFVHAIAPQTITNIFTRNLLCLSKPYDAHICPSKSLAISVKKYYESASQYLKDCHKIDIRYKGRLEILPLGIDAMRFKLRNRTTARKNLGLPENRVIVLCLTRLSPYNKMDLFPLLKAFKNAIKIARDKNAVLVIAGKEQFKGYAKAIETFSAILDIKNLVLVRTDPKNDDIPLYYNACDIFISPSDNLQETFGLTPIEAMLCGATVVASDWNGYKEAIIDEETGFLVPTIWGKCNSETERLSAFTDFPHTLLTLAQSVALDIQKMSEILARLIDNPRLRKSVSKKALKIAYNKYSWNKIIPQYERLYTELSAEAQADKSKIEYNRHFSIPPYFDAFSHYPSHLLEIDSKIKRSKLGDQWLKDRRSRAAYLITSTFNNKELASKILKKSSEWTAVGSFIAENKEKVLYQILHMMKLGLLLFRP